MSNLLVLVRHGESEWNLKNLFTGWKNPDLTEKGRLEAQNTGKKLAANNIRFDLAFTSALKRAQHSCEEILNSMQQTNIKIIKNPALNERDYGDLSGLNKDEAKLKWGEDLVQKWRRSYRTPPPNGESLCETSARVLSYYIQKIIPELVQGKNILITAHGNSLRALIMTLENLSPEEIISYELSTGQSLIYKLNKQTEIIQKIII